MQRKTEIHAEEGKQELLITREFDLPIELLFKAYVEPAIVEQWMGTKVLKLECQPHGSWRFETSNPQGNVVFQSNGVFHDVVQNSKITRTFEMDGTSFGVQLEFLDFERLRGNTSKLRMHVVYRSVAVRDQILKLPFAYGINMAHDRLQEIMEKTVKTEN